MPSGGWTFGRRAKATERLREIAKRGSGNDEWKALGEKRKPAPPERFRLTPLDVLGQRNCPAAHPDR